MKTDRTERVACPTCQQKFHPGTALKTHIRMKHPVINGNGHTNGNGDAAKYFELPLTNGLVLRMDKAAGLQMASTILAELQR